MPEEKQPSAGEAKNCDVADPLHKLEDMDLDVDLSIDESVWHHSPGGGALNFGVASEDVVDVTGEAVGISSAKTTPSEEGPPTSVTIQRDFATLIDHARERTEESRAEYINRLALEDFAPNPRAKADVPIESMVKIAGALAPFGWGFGVKTFPLRETGDATLYLAELKSDLFSFSSLHHPEALFNFANELRHLAKHGGGGTLSPLGGGEHGKGAVYVAKRNRRTIVLDITMFVRGERHSESSVVISSRDIEKTARFFEYLAVITDKAKEEYPEGF